jgi:hypothetical protein
LPSTQELVPVARGHQRYAALLEVRSSALESFADPSRLTISVRDRGRTLSPSSFGPGEIDGVPVRVRFAEVLEAGELQQAWFVFDLPEDLDSAEIWLSKDSWLARTLPGWEATPLHEKAIFALEIDGGASENRP